MANFKVNFCDLQLQYLNLKDEIDPAIQEVLESTQFINGPQVTQLEKNIAKYCDSSFAVGVSSGTDALLLSLMAIDIQPGDEVITTPFTFIATAETIAILGAKPVFVDINADTYNIDVNQIEDKITPKTKVILPVHLYGQMADMNSIMKLAEKHNLTVIEDAAQSIGAEFNNKKAGSFGDFGCLSFFPAKTLGCYGDGGMVIAKDQEKYDKLKMIRNHGSQKKYLHGMIGVNGRLDTLQAAVLLVKLKHLDNWIESRIKIANNYSEQLKEYVTTPVIAEGYKHSFNYYALKTDKQEQLLAYLNENGIPTAVYYPIPLHLQEAFQDLGYKEGDMPVSEKTAKEIFSIPIYPEMTEEEQNIVIGQIKNFFTK